LRLPIGDQSRKAARSAAQKASLSTALLAAPFGIASCVHGYADKDECDDNH